MIRAAGATLLTTATVKFTLKEAALRGQLYMDTFQRLNFALVLQNAACLAVLAQAVSLRSGALTAFVGGLCGAGLVLASRVYSLNRQGGGLPLPSPSRTLSAAISVLLPRNGPATAYSLLTLGCAGMAAMCLGAAPGGDMVLYEGIRGPMAVFAERMTGAGLLLMTLVAYSLKDGADREKLGATTFRWLNLGASASFLAMAAYTLFDFEAPGVMRHGPKAAGMLAALLVSFAWTSWMYIAGTSKPKPAVAAA